MDIFIALAVLGISYLIGSIPFGLIIVKLTTGKDIRHVESGRTGGTNAMRAAGFFAGAFTAIFDGAKGLLAVWLARWLVSDPVTWKVWIEVLAPICAILGHNYSIFLMERNVSGRFRLYGGAGGAPCVGGSIGLWPWSAVIIIPVGLLVLFGVGYASLATMSFGLMSILIFAYRAWIGASPWQYIFYGVFAEILLLIALRPNIKRLLNGTERLVGWRVRHKKRAIQSSSISSSSS